MLIKKSRTVTIWIIVVVIVVIASRMTFPSAYAAKVKSPESTHSSVLVYEQSGQFLVAQSKLSSPFLAQVLWQPLEFTITPPERIKSSLVLNPINRIVLLFGGLGSSGDEFNDLWITDGLQWIQYQTPHSPETRSAASTAYDEGMQNVVLFGGSSRQVLLGDTWLFTGTDWVKQEPSLSPAPRAGAHMAYDAIHGITVLFGGLVDVGNSIREPTNETWIWDGTYWHLLNLENAPSPRWGAGMVYDRAHQSILLFGGATEGGYYDETWLWDGASWTESHPLHHPGGRSDFGMAYDESRQQVILFGGQSFAYVDTTETWAWDGQDWIKLNTLQSPPEELTYGAELVYVPYQETVMLYNPYRPKLVAVRAGIPSFWIFNNRYFIHMPLIHN